MCIFVHPVAAAHPHAVGQVLTTGCHWAQHPNSRHLCPERSPCRYHPLSTGGLHWQGCAIPPGLLRVTAQNCLVCICLPSIWNPGSICRHAPSARPEPPSSPGHCCCQPPRVHSLTCSTQTDDLLCTTREAKVTEFQLCVFPPVHRLYSGFIHCPLQ